MFVLLDNDVPYGLRRLLRPHSCLHAKQFQWATLTNGHLLRAAEARNFDVLVTADQGIFYQQTTALERSRSCCFRRPDGSRFERRLRKL